MSTITPPKSKVLSLREPANQYAYHVLVTPYTRRGQTGWIAVVWTGANWIRVALDVIIDGYAERLVHGILAAQDILRPWPSGPTVLYIADPLILRLLTGDREDVSSRRLAKYAAMAQEQQQDLGPVTCFSMRSAPRAARRYVEEYGQPPVPIVDGISDAGVEMVAQRIEDDAAVSDEVLVATRMRKYWARTRGTEMPPVLPRIVCSRIDEMTWDRLSEESLTQPLFLGDDPDNPMLKRDTRGFEPGSDEPLGELH